MPRSRCPPVTDVAAARVYRMRSLFAVSEFASAVLTSPNGTEVVARNGAGFGGRDVYAGLAGRLEAHAARRLAADG